MAHENKLQDVIGDDLFPTVQNISDVKQVLEFIEPNAKALRETQIRAILFLNELGEDKEMHPTGNPYKGIIESIIKHRTSVADPEVYLDTIEALIPKPPKPIIMTQNGQVQKVPKAR